MVPMNVQDNLWAPQLIPWNPEDNQLENLVNRKVAFTKTPIAGDELQLVYFSHMKIKFFDTKSVQKVIFKKFVDAK